MIRSGLTAAALAILLGASSCRVMPQDCARADIVCVGLVTGYGGTEAGLQHQAWLALQDAEANGEVDRIDHIDTVDTRDRSANLAYFAEAGYDIIVTAGAGIADDAASAARLHPDVLMVILQPGHERVEAPPNLLRFEFREENAGFLAGAAAAMVTRTQHVAAVCEARFLDYVERYCEGFAAGVNFIDDEVRARVIYRDGAAELLFQDTEWAQATAAQAIEDGADVVFAVGESTARAALFQAARSGVLVIGAQTDIFVEEPDIAGQLVSSAMLDVRRGLHSIIQEQLKSGLPSPVYRGTVGLAPFREYESRLPPGAASELERIAADLNSGILITGLPFEGP